MPAARCSMCAANYPAELDGESCPNCGERLYLQRDEEPDPELLHYAQRSLPALPPAAVEEPSPVATQVVVRDGLLWVRDAALRELGYYDLDTFDRVEIDGDCYEVQGFKASSGEWWVEPVAAGATAERA